MKKAIFLLAALLLAQPAFALSPTKSLIKKQAMFCAWFQSMGFRCKHGRV